MCKCRDHGPASQKRNHDCRQRMIAWKSSEKPELWKKEGRKNGLRTGDELVQEALFGEAEAVRQFSKDFLRFIKSERIIEKTDGCLTENILF